MCKMRMNAVQRFVITIIALTCLVTFNGCIKMKTIVQVNPDGSGLIFDTMQIREDVVEMFKSFVQQMAEQMTKGEAKQSPTPMTDFFDEEAIRKKAKQYGSDVKLISIKREKKDGFLSATAVYAFSDITNVRLPMGQSTRIKEIATAKSATVQTAKFVTFQMHKLADGTSELIIHMPPITAKKEGPKPKPPQREKMGKEGIEFFKHMFKDFEILVAIDCGAQVLKTNASHCDGNRITLLHLAMDEIIKQLEDADNLEALAQFTPQPQSMQQIQQFLQQFLKNFKGIKFEMQRVINVRFK